MIKLLKKLWSVRSETLVRIACVLGLIALPLMVWSVIEPSVWPVLVALSIGQAIGTASFVLYLVVVVRDLGVVRRLRMSLAPPPPPPPPPPPSQPRRDE